MKRVVPIVRAIVFAIIFILSTSRSFSQSISVGKIEVGVGIGPLVFLGDLGGSQGYGRTFVKDVDMPLTKLNKGIFLNVYPTEWLGIRLAGNVGVLEGNDAEAPNKGGDEVTRLQRNLNFETNLKEAYLAIEFYPTAFVERYDGLIGKLRPYGVIGAGVFHFNPKTKDDNGNWVALQPLHTEGQGFAEYPTRKDYKLTQLEIPIGFGAKLFFRENMYIGVEVLHRKLFTDYVDDVSTNYIDPVYFDQHLSSANAAMARSLSYRGTYTGMTVNNAAGQQRGNPKQNDAYFSTIIKLGWRLNGSNSPNDRAANQMRCPKYY
jgi:hypothetical protein